MSAVIRYRYFAFAFCLFTGKVMEYYCVIESQLYVMDMCWSLIAQHPLIPL